LLNSEKVDKICRNNGASNKLKLCEKAEAVYDEKKFTYMIVLGILSIFGGALIARTGVAYSASGCGISFGGMMLVLYFTIKNWNTLSKNLQITILGLALFALMYGSVTVLQRQK
jgi:hypothetical protein